MTRHRWLIAVALTMATLTAACSTSSDPKKNPNSSADSTSSSPSGSTSAPQSSSSSSPVVTPPSIEQTVQAAWVNYWKVSVDVTDYPRAQWKSRIAAVSVDPIYTELINAVRVQYDKLGEIGYGYIESRPYWPKPPTASTKSVVMGDCFDGSHTGAKIKKTGKVKTVGEPRTNVHVTLVLGADRKWRVMQIEYLKASC